MAQQLKSCQEVATYALLFGQKEALKQYELTNDQLNSIINETDFAQLSMFQQVKKLVLDLSKKVKHTQPTISGYTGVPVFMVSKIIKQDPQRVQNQKEDPNKGKDLKKGQKQNTSQALENPRKIRHIISVNEKKQEGDQADNIEEEEKENHENQKGKENKIKYKKTYQCPDCENEFVTNKEMKEHVKLNHKKKRGKSKQIICQDCNLSFKSQKKFKKHQKQQHGQESESRSESEMANENQNSETITNGKKKEKSRGPKKNFPCNFCNRVFFHNFYLHSHLSQVHDEKCKGRAPSKPNEEEKIMYRCQNCDHLADDEKQLEAHQSTHKGNQEGEKNDQQTRDVSKCVLCSKELPSLKELAEHMKTEHQQSNSADSQNFNRQFFN